MSIYHGPKLNDTYIQAARRAANDGGIVQKVKARELQETIDRLLSLNPSILVIPTLGNVSKLYSTVPSFADFSVTRASSKRVLGPAGTLVEYANNVPAFEWNADGSYRGLLVEPGATNLLLRSQEFGTTWATADGASVTADTAVAPDGTTTADTIALSTTVSSRVQQSSLSLANSTRYTISVFLKNIALTSGQTFQLRLNNAQVAPNNFVINATIDLFAGTVVYSQSGTDVTGISGTGTASIESYPNGWYRVSLSATTGTGAVSATAVVSLIQPSPSAARTFYAWGAQLETGSVATSYIPTVASTANRSADAITLTGASSLIGQTGGGIYAEFEAVDLQPASALRIVQIADGAPDRVQFVRNTGNKSLDLQVFANNVNSVSINTGVLTLLNTVHKIAFRYQSGNSRACVNGTLSATNATAFTFSATLANVGAGNAADGTLPFNGRLRALALFATPPSDSQLQTLTTP